MYTYEPIIGKYKVLETRELKTRDESIQVPILTTDNCREAVWIANKNPQHLTPVHICGERDFYQGLDGNWHSFEL